jgi:hypothetical protein
MSCSWLGAVEEGRELSGRNGDKRGVRATEQRAPTSTEAGRERFGKVCESLFPSTRNLLDESSVAQRLDGMAV